MGRIRVLSIKVALVTMCSGKLMDKLRCKLVNTKYFIVNEMLVTYTFIDYRYIFTNM